MKVSVNNELNLDQEPANLKIMKIIISGSCIPPQGPTQSLFHLFHAGEKVRPVK